MLQEQFGVSPSVYLRGKNDPEEKENDDKEEETFEQE